MEGAPPEPAVRQRGSVIYATDGSVVGPSTPSTLNVGNKYNSYNIKVVKAEKLCCGSKVEFKAIDNMFIDINASNANITYVTACVHKQWGENHVVVSKDGLEIGDSAATRGWFVCAVRLLYS